MTTHTSQNGDSAFIGGLLLGLLVGAALGLWKAARSGAELRQQLLQQGADMRGKAGQAVLGERVEDAVAEGKAVAQQRQVEISRGA